MEEVIRPMKAKRGMDDKKDDLSEKMKVGLYREGKTTGSREIKKR